MPTIGEYSPPGDNWGEKDIESLSRKLDEPHFYDGRPLEFTSREYRALAELNWPRGGDQAEALTSPLVVWVAERGLFSVVRRR